MSLTLVPNTVAQKTTMATPDAKKLLASPYSLSSSRLCAHANRKQSQRAKKGSRQLARAVHVLFDEPLTVSNSRKTVNKEDVELAGTPTSRCGG